MTTVLSQLNCLSRDNVATVNPYLRLCIWIWEAEFPKNHCVLWKVLVLAAAHFEWCEHSRAHQAKKQDSNLVLDSCYKQKLICKVPFVRWTEVTVVVKPHFVSWGCNRFQEAICHPVTAEAQVWSLASPCGVYGGQSGTGTSFSVSTSVFRLLVSLLPCSVHIHSAFIYAV